MAGQQAACPSCQTAVVLPAVATSEPAGAPLTAAAPTSAPASSAPQAAAGKSNQTQLYILVAVVILLGGFAGFYFLGPGGGPAAPTFRELKQAIADGDHKAAFGHFDEESQKILVEIAGSYGPAQAETAGLEGAEKFAKYKEAVDGNQRAKMIGAKVLEWMASGKVKSAETEGDQSTLTIEYEDGRTEKLVANKQDDQWKFKIKRTNSRIYDAVAATYAGEFGGGGGGRGQNPGGNGGPGNGGPGNNGPGKGGAGGPNPNQ